MTPQLCPIGVKPYRAYYLTTTSCREAPTISSNFYNPGHRGAYAIREPLLTINKEERIMIYYVKFMESELVTMDRECAMNLRDNYGATVTERPYIMGGGAL